jgi:hypothetical protein
MAVGQIKLICKAAKYMLLHDNETVTFDATFAYQRKKSSDREDDPGNLVSDSPSGSWSTDHLSK